MRRTSGRRSEPLGKIDAKLGEGQPAGLRGLLQVRSPERGLSALIRRGGRMRQSSPHAPGPDGSGRVMPVVLLRALQCAG